VGDILQTSTHTLYCTHSPVYMGLVLNMDLQAAAQY